MGGEMRSDMKGVHFEPRVMRKVGVGAHERGGCETDFRGRNTLKRGRCRKGKRLSLLMARG